VSFPKVIAGKFRKQSRERQILLNTLFGATLCGVSAGVIAKLFQHVATRYVVPLCFLLVLAVIARVFGVVAGVVGCVIATIIFAVVLFAPVGSLSVGNLKERSSVAWMALLGLAVSYFVGKSIERKL
jgi:K+-sensing histidine kinase KdpD